MSVVCIIACRQPSKPKEKNLFEGFVEMDIAYGTDDQTEQGLYESMLGNKVITYIKNGFVNRTYYNSNNIIVRRELYIHDSLKLYSYTSKSDTIFYIDVTSPKIAAITSFKEIRPKNILQHYCKGASIDMSIYTTDTTDPLKDRYEYYFDTVNHLPQDLYEGNKYGNYDELFRLYPYINLQIKDVNLLTNTTITMTATKIVKTKLDNTLFKLPANKVFINAY